MRNARPFFPILIHTYMASLPYPTHSPLARQAVVGDDGQQRREDGADDEGPAAARLQWLCVVVEAAICFCITKSSMQMHGAHLGR
jgi:hypothetical protein